MLWLSEHSSKALGSLELLSDLRFLAASTQAYPRASHGDLIGIFRDYPRAGNLMDRKKFLWLEPTSDGRLPILGISYDFGQIELPQICLRVGLMTLPDNEGPPGAIGFRFESPMGIGGTHDYYHAQIFCEFTREAGWPRLPNCPDWLSETTPAFKLDARNPVQLLATLVISLYGLRYVGLLNQFGADLAAAIREMHEVAPFTG